MEISFAPELVAKLNQIASQTEEGTGPNRAGTGCTHLGHDEWFRREVGKGLASLDRGESLSHEEVRRRMERILGS